MKGASSMKYPLEAPFYVLVIFPVADGSALRYHQHR